MISVNEYFDGGVKSLGYTNNGKSTVGVINAGEYEFGTTTPETMKIIEGEMHVMLLGKTEWTLYLSGDSFKVPANSSFKVKLNEQVSYLCKYK